jgi:butyrate kinase
MFDIGNALDKQILKRQNNRPTVILTEPLDPRIVEASCFLSRFARLVFLASEKEVREVISSIENIDSSRIEFTLGNAAFIEIDKQPELLNELADACLALPNEIQKASTKAEALELLKDPAQFGIMAVKEGHADMVVGGLTHEPKAFFRPMLRTLQVSKTMCEVGIFVLPPDHPTGIFPHNIVIFGDVGVNAEMTPEKLSDVAVATCAVARDIIPQQELPVIYGAITSYSHKGSDEGPAAEMVHSATELVPEKLKERVKRGSRYSSIHIEGEVKISCALSHRSAMYYDHGEEDPYTGRTNVIITPNLDMGNLLYHLYSTRYPDAKKFPVISGIRFRGVELAMDSTSEDCLLAIKANLLRLQRYGEWTRTEKDTFFPRQRILCLNPGSTSTKMSVFEGDLEQFSVELQHSAEELKPFEDKPITAQYEFRKNVVLTALRENGYSRDDLDAISARGGLVRAIPHGTYAIDDQMIADLHEGKKGDHASNLGALIADELGRKKNLPSFITDPVVVDEVRPDMLITGFKRIKRQVISHALNQIATARRYAEESETFYEKMNLIVCHMGGGITVGAHCKGRYIDVNNGLNGEGPFSPQRSGSIPTGQLIDLCFSGELTQAELKQLNKGRGGLIDLLGTADLREVEKRVADGDKDATAVYEAMIYDISKNITALLPAFSGEKVDQVLLTGGMARSKQLVERITQATSAMGCGLTAYPGENEMMALAKGALRVLNNQEPALKYSEEK